MNQSLSYTVVFTMVSSLISAATVMPTFFYMFKPVEKKELRINKVLDLFPGNYDGSIEVKAYFRECTRLEVMDEEVRQIEDIILEDDNFEFAELGLSGSEVLNTAYAEERCDRSSEEAVEYYTDMFREIAGMGSAIVIAIFWVFLVMAIQFISPKYSLMAMMGFLMLIGMVVNNGILLVDMADSLRQDSGMVMMKGMGFVIIGGLCTSTILALFLMPPFYLVMSGPFCFQKKKRKRD